MNRLQLNFYIVYPTNAGDFSVILLNLLYFPRLIENARFVEQLKSMREEFPGAAEKPRYFDLLHKWGKSKTADTKVNQNFLSLLDKALPYLNRISHNDGRPFLPKGLKFKDEIYLPTERFFWRFPTTNLGSARQGLLLDLQIKGNGRNPLAIRTDYSHTWGGNFIWQSLKGYAVSSLFAGVLPQGILKTCMVTAENEEIGNQVLKTSAKSLQFREMNGLRVTQVATDFDPMFKPSRDEVLIRVLREQKVKSGHDLMMKNLFMYSSMLLMGVRHFSITKENITVEGQLLDYEDVEYSTNDEIYDFQIHFMIPFEKQSPPPQVESIFDKRLTKYLKKSRLFTSSLHQALFSAEFARIGIQSIDPEYKTSEKAVRKQFTSMLSHLSSELFETQSEWKQLIKDLLPLEAGLTSGSNSPDFGDEIYPLISKYRHLCTAQEIRDDGSCLSVILTLPLPRPKLRHAFAESFNQHRKNTKVEQIVEVMFKTLQLKTLNSPLSPSEMLDYSSHCNALLARQSKIFPYEILNGEITLKAVGKKKLMAELKEKIEKVLGLKIVKISCFVNRGENKQISPAEILQIKGQLIVSALEVELPDGSGHIITYGPRLIK